MTEQLMTGNVLLRQHAHAHTHTHTRTHAPFGFLTKGSECWSSVGVARDVAASTSGTSSSSSYTYREATHSLNRVHQSQEVVLLKPAPGGTPGGAFSSVLTQLGDRPLLYPPSPPLPPSLSSPHSPSLLLSHSSLSACATLPEMVDD